MTTAVQSTNFCNEDPPIERYTKGGFVESNAMLLKRWSVFASFAVVGITVAAGIQAGAKLIINGKSVPGESISIKGQTYIPVSSIKAAGGIIEAKDGAISISFPASGGANQVAALEGRIGDWLFNGIWRLRILGVVANDDGRAGWKVHVELRNGTKLDQISLGGTGFSSMSLVMADGIAITPYNITDLDRPLAQGASADVQMVFYDDDGNGRRPEKLLVRIEPDGATKSFLKSQGVSYTSANPSFRINLKSDAKNVE
jgi:hypothetical protein